MTNERSMELLNAVMNYISVAETCKETIHKLFSIGFTADELIQDFNWSLTDVREAEYDELIDELARLVKIERNDDLTDEEKSRYVVIVDILRENNIDIPFGIEI